MALKRQSRNARQTAISPKLKAFFESGALANGSDPDITTEDGDIFILACSEQKMLESWLPYREEILASWKQQKREDLPWIEGHLRSYGLLNDENTSD